MSTVMALSLISTTISIIGIATKKYWTIPIAGAFLVLAIVKMFT